VIFKILQKTWLSSLEGQKITVTPRNWAWYKNVEKSEKCSTDSGTPADPKKKQRKQGQSIPSN
jgi:hypothetical protein